MSDLVEATAQLTSELNRHRLLDKVLAAAQRLLRADEAMLWLCERDPSAVQLTATTFGRLEHARGHSHLRFGAGIEGRALTSRVPFRSDDIQREPDFANTELFRKIGTRGFLGVPLVDYGEVVGLISVATRRKHLFSDAGVEIARSFAGQAAVAITNARLFEEAHRRTARLAVLNRLGAQVAASIDRDEILRRIARAGQGLFDGGLVRLWLLDSAGAQLELVAGAGPSEGLPERALRIPVDGSLYGRVMRRGRSYSTRDVWPEALPRGDLGAEPFSPRTGLIVPLMHEGRALGVIAVLVRSDESFRTEDIGLLEALASYAALALENARLADEVGRLEGQRQLDRLKGEFLSAVSRELRTPLSFIHGYSELLSVRTLALEQVKEMASEIHRGSTTMVRMVDDLLDFSQFVTGRLGLRLCPTDLSKLRAATATVQVAQSSKHSLRLEISPGLPRISGDPDRLRQIVVNLLANAVQYSPDGGQVIVRACLDGDQVRVEVEDQGRGIEPHEQSRVFDKFYRSTDAIISPIRGIGLGLAIVKNLVEAHGGNVGVRSTPGSGSVFFFSLPLEPAVLRGVGDTRESERLEEGPVLEAAG